MIRYMAIQLFNGVKHMRDHGFAHRDIKPENVCFGEAFNLCLVDWGFATPYRPGLFQNDTKGSQAYMAPEVRAQESYDAHKADIFSLGTLLFTLKTRKYPWNLAKKTEDSLYAPIAQGQPERFWSQVTPVDQPEYFDG